MVDCSRLGALHRVGPGENLRRKLSRFFFDLSRGLASKLQPRLQHMHVNPADHIGAYICTEGYYERDLLLALDALLDRVGAGRSVALDIGANIGNHALFFAERFERVIAFEPNPRIVRVLQANALSAPRRNIVVRDVGLGEVAGAFSFRDDHADNSGSARFVGSDAARSGDQQIEVSTGDQQVALLLPAGQCVDLVKIDVEGGEAQVLKGLRDVLRQHAPVVVFEAADDASLRGTMAVLTDVGYQAFVTLEGGSSDHRLLRMLQKLFFAQAVQARELMPLEHGFLSMVVALPARCASSAAGPAGARA